MFQIPPVSNHIKDKAHQTPYNYFLQTRYHFSLSALCCTPSFHSLTEVLKFLCLLSRRVNGLDFLWTKLMPVHYAASGKHPTFHMLVTNMVTSNESLHNFWVNFSAGARYLHEIFFCTNLTVYLCLPSTK